MELVRDFAERTGGQPPGLITSDEYASYPIALAAQYPAPTGQPVGDETPHVHPDLVYATICKKRQKAGLSRW